LSRKADKCQPLLVGSSILVIFGGWHTDFVDDLYTLDVTSWRQGLILAHVSAQPEPLSSQV
jgi:hypothetical protein